ncbi:hypothetical protein LXL04_039842 [Taraxacum kok-saghyz]
MVVMPHLCTFGWPGLRVANGFDLMGWVVKETPALRYQKSRCYTHESLSDGFGVIQNEGDYREFIEVTFAIPGKKVKVYIDYNDEPLFDWIELENPDEVDDLEFPTEQDEEAEETPFADGIKAEHQEDAVETKPEPVDDPFLNKLCPKREEADGEFQQEYPFHNPNMAWDNMVPVIGMQFSNPAELKELLANYAVKHGPKISYGKMKAFVSKEFNITVSIGQCRNARKFALSEIEGNLIEHYGRLWDYAEEIRRSNPGSTVQALLDRGFFKGFYVCFKGVRDGWVDGLVVENRELWQWFLDLLMNDIEGGNGGGLTIMSDGHKGLIEAIKDRVPDVEHRLCARHILANFRPKFGSEEHRKMCWVVVYSTTPQQFQSAMQVIQQMDEAAYAYLMDRNPDAWSRAYFLEGMMCDAMENGVSESFNAVIKDMRRKPIISMLEDIRLYVMQRLFNQRVMEMEWDLEICPSVRRELQDMKVKQRMAIDRNPCLHAMTAITSLNQNAEDYVHSCFTKNSFLNTYSYSIQPMNGSTIWPNTTYTKILPPVSRRLPGRPKTKRKKGQFEKENDKKQKTTRAGRTQRCSYCQAHGHKKHKCPRRASASSGMADGGNEGGTEGGNGGTEGGNEGGTEGGNGGTEGGNEGGPSGGRTEGPSGGRAEEPSGGRTRRGIVPPVSRRRPSERILKAKLRKNVITKDGKGGSGDKPVSCLKLLISVCIASISSFSSHSQIPHLPTGQTNNLLPGLAAVLDVRMRGVRPHPQGVFATTWFGKEEEEEAVDIGESDFQEEEERSSADLGSVELRPRTTDHGPSPTSNSPIKRLGPRTESDITGKFSVCDFSPRTGSDAKSQTTDRVRHQTDTIKRTDHGPSPWSESESLVRRSIKQPLKLVNSEVATGSMLISIYDSIIILPQAT